MNSSLSNVVDKPSAQAPSWSMRSEKIQARHRERLAVVYIRQSTPQQLARHQESTQIQYSLKRRAIELGWPAERIMLVDDDQGQSGSSAENRLGFQRVVSEVTLDHVGIILGVEMSRLARSCDDWYPLLKVCSLFGTLIGDLDGVYNPSEYNDRLLLGLKGTMSEAELHIIKQRMLQGKLNKARRGELGVPLPIGYVRRPSGEIAMDPDEQVQSVVRIVFSKFEELGTLNAVLQYLVRNKIELGIRMHGGPSKGELEWHRPNRMTLQNLLRHPLYAGAYAYGRRQIDLRRKKAGRPGTGRVVMPQETWKVLLKDRLPAYISWDQYEQNIARLKSNRALAGEKGAVRKGLALLSGLVMCGKCGCRMSVHYDTQGKRHTYACRQMLSNYGGPLCQSIAGAALDQYVGAAVLQALEPASLELSLEAAKNLERERQNLLHVWQQRLERVGYESDRAARHYRAVDPENRLVARQLEREWEGKLTEQKKLEEEFHRFEQSQPRVLSEGEREAIRSLAADIPALWDMPTTTSADRKDILRQVTDRVVVDTQGNTERVRVMIHWAEGTETQGEMIRPVAKLSQLSYYPRLCERIRSLHAEGVGAKKIAERLNEEGLRPPKRRERFGKQGILTLMRELGLREQRLGSRARIALKQHEWRIIELAQKIPMPTVTLFNWIGRGWVKARRQNGTSGQWILWADEEELQRLQERAQRPTGYYTRRRWVGEGQEANSPGVSRMLN